MAKIDRALAKITRRRSGSRNIWLSVLAALGISATAAISLSKRRGNRNRWVRKLQGDKHRQTS